MTGPATEKDLSPSGSSGPINYETPPPTHLEMCRGVLLAMVTVVERQDGPRQLHNSNDDNDDDDNTQTTT